MADPIDLSMVVSSALPATFTFLYQRLDDLMTPLANPEMREEGKYDPWRTRSTCRWLSAVRCLRRLRFSTSGWRLSSLGTDPVRVWLNQRQRPRFLLWWWANWNCRCALMKSTFRRDLLNSGRTHWALRTTRSEERRVGKE